ncbi:MAG: hypothetical protein OXH92_00010 [Bryobacterales bacterium]|nr:hypothetical protein [Bryobacterales bacterium]
MMREPQPRLFRFIREVGGRIDERSGDDVKRLATHVAFLRVLMMAMLTELSPTAHDRIRDSIEAAVSDHLFGDLDQEREKEQSA